MGVTETADLRFWADASEMADCAARIATASALQSDLSSVSGLDSVLNHVRHVTRTPRSDTS